MYCLRIIISGCLLFLLVVSVVADFERIIKAKHQDRKHHKKRARRDIISVVHQGETIPQFRRGRPYIRRGLINPKEKLDLTREINTSEASNIKKAKRIKDKNTKLALRLASRAAPPVDPHDDVGHMPQVFL